MRIMILQRVLLVMCPSLTMSLRQVSLRWYIRSYQTRSDSMVKQSVEIAIFSASTQTMNVLFSIVIV